MRAVTTPTWPCCWVPRRSYRACATRFRHHQVDLPAGRGRTAGGRAGRRRIDGEGERARKTRRSMRSSDSTSSRWRRHDRVSLRPDDGERGRVHDRVKGKQTHGAVPWNGVDPIVIGAQIVLSLQTIVSRQVNITEAPAVVTVGMFNAGNRTNIIPETAELGGTIRAYGESARTSIAASTTSRRRRQKRRAARRRSPTGRHSGHDERSGAHRDAWCRR